MLHTKALKEYKYWVVHQYLLTGFQRAGLEQLWDEIFSQGFWWIWNAIKLTLEQPNLKLFKRVIPLTPNLGFRKHLQNEGQLASFTNSLLCCCTKAECNLVNLISGLQSWKDSYMVVSEK
jgi:hypothetical protein